MTNLIGTEQDYLLSRKYTLTNPQLLQIYLLACVLVNFACLFFNSHGSDMGFWFNWLDQLTTKGYANFKADYPPMYIHWIYTVSKIVSAMGLTVDNNILFKMLFGLPNIACHLIVLAIINHLLNYSGASRTNRHILLAMTAFNPAILYDGPIWGQVDIIPAMLALIAILLQFSARFRVFSIPFYMLALLTKFQMICFAPVMGVLFFRHFKINIVGTILGALVFLAAFYPFILQDEFVQYFSQAYIKTLGQYAYTTFNAGNLWMLISANTMPDSQIMFTLFQDSKYETNVIAKYFGIFLFFLVCLLVFGRGIKQQLCNKLGTESAQKNDILFLSLICSVGFFTLLPAMHERYLFPAVIIAMAYAAITPKGIAYAILVSLVSFINVSLVHGVAGSDIWFGLSILCVFTLALALLQFFVGPSLYTFSNEALKLIARIKWLGFLSFVGVTVSLSGYLIQTNKALDVTLNAYQMLLTEMQYSSASQGHGTLKINRSVDSKILSIGDQHYAKGLGTHAPSSIVYMLPEGAREFTFMVGVDDESKNSSDMQFSVWGDGKKLWQSSVLYGFEKINITETVNITNVRELMLQVDSLSSMDSDHADWINPVITFDHIVK